MRKYRGKCETKDSIDVDLEPRSLGSRQLAATRAAKRTANHRAFRWKGTESMLLAENRDEFAGCMAFTAVPRSRTLIVGDVRRGYVPDKAN